MDLWDMAGASVLIKYTINSSGFQAVPSVFFLPKSTWNGLIMSISIRYPVEQQTVHQSFPIEDSGKEPRQPTLGHLFCYGQRRCFLGTLWTKSCVYTYYGFVITTTNHYCSVYYFPCKMETLDTNRPRTKRTRTHTRLRENAHKGIQIKFNPKRMVIVSFSLLFSFVSVARMADSHLSLDCDVSLILVLYSFPIPPIFLADILCLIFRAQSASTTEVHRIFGILLHSNAAKGVFKFSRYLG